ncbi:PREDICTED: uncharacterized protein LOC106791374 [Polistes canadensis]|uniref:uncharacterized protein LOC106791374 n=1 Tax=Polistes canadensis TaxID=91411 RepID=UPI0007190072|nr:PREDICTED: uncharacterized protein LOC106791374 [Polistes canadensis]
MGSSNKSRRHYKKDSRFVADLYTFTYDDFDLEDDNETTKAPVLVPEVTIREKPKEEKDPEREDLIARFDRLIRGDPDETLQVQFILFFLKRVMGYYNVTFMLLFFLEKEKNEEEE